MQKLQNCGSSLYETILMVAKQFIGKKNFIK